MQCESIANCLSCVANRCQFVSFLETSVCLPLSRQVTDPASVIGPGFEDFCPPPASPNGNAPSSSLSSFIIMSEHIFFIICMQTFTHALISHFLSYFTFSLQCKYMKCFLFFLGAILGLFWTLVGLSIMIYGIIWYFRVKPAYEVLCRFFSSWRDEIWE